jgi:hypothetical protein
MKCICGKEMIKPFTDSEYSVCIDNNNIYNPQSPHYHHRKISYGSQQYPNSFSDYNEIITK